MTSLGTRGQCCSMPLLKVAGFSRCLNCVQRTSTKGRCAGKTPTFLRAALCATYGHKRHKPCCEALSLAAAASKLFCFVTPDVGRESTTSSCCSMVQALLSHSSVMRVAMTILPSTHILQRSHEDHPGLRQVLAQIPASCVRGPSTLMLHNAQGMFRLLLPTNAAGCFYDKLPAV